MSSFFAPPPNYQRGARVAVPRPIVSCAINGIAVRQLLWNVDPRGALIEVRRASWGLTRLDDGPDRTEIQQVYISTTQAGTVKGWHLHAIQTDRFFLLSGRALLVTCDLRAVGRGGPIGPFVETMLDPRAPVSVDVLPGVAHGWIALEDCAILNCVSHEYQGDDEYRTDPHGPVCPGGPAYAWRRTRDG